ncbi:hypothetical protein SDC9_171190 [bioreactor metagenome]|uniref:Uncharacterized protein n=1 Tax=bioreactor metagenome TaxID=1076179 RepID=A0A645GA60_9ZZZZ
MPDILPFFVFAADPLRVLLVGRIQPHLVKMQLKQLGHGNADQMLLPGDPDALPGGIPCF